MDLDKKNPAHVGTDIYECLKFAAASRGPGGLTDVNSSSAFNHPSIIYTAYTLRDVCRGCNQSQLRLGRRGGTPFIDRQCIAGLMCREKQPFILTFTQIIENSTQLTDSNPEPSCYEATVLTTAGLCRPLLSIKTHDFHQQMVFGELSNCSCSN